MAGKYDHLSKEELVSLLLKRDATRKLGLVWERDELEHENALNQDFVTLDLNEPLSIGDAPYDNLLIEADNFDALRFLHIAYRGRIKCIYIDPPYNTGKKDFIYNDRFVDKDDAWKHSKWLETMYQRLVLAKDLLAHDGVMFVSIGEDEFAHLSLLLDQVFPKMKVGTFVWRRRSGANDEKEWFLSVDHEYVLCYANPGFSFAGTLKDWSSAIDDGDTRGPWIDGPLNQGKDIRQRPDAFYTLYNPETETWYPCDPDTVWRFASKERMKPGKKIRTRFMEEMVSEKRISWPENKSVVVYDNTSDLWEAILNGTAPHNLRVYERVEAYKADVAAGSTDPRVVDNIPPLEFWVGKRIGYGKPRQKRFISEIKKTDKPISTWILPASTKKSELEDIDLSEVESFTVGYTSEGTSLLAKMIGNKDFPYPKPLSLMKALIRQATDPQSGHIVLDFFAGSGTTGHAVLDLNNDDDGDRRFILVSSTEATEQEPDKNVCSDITIKRLRAAVDGYSWRTARGVQSVQGLGGTVAYMKAHRIPIETLHLDIRHDQIWYALQMVHSYGVRPFVDGLDFQSVEVEDYRVVYLPQLNEKVFDSLVKYVSDKRKPTIIYSWQSGLLKQRLQDDHVLVEKIPEYLTDRFGGQVL